ncbi:MAG: histidinol dehydrogenase [Armatimonadota bacterium]|nr:MAG: histidinol dehydrogenase [Armatimonadota bacterium]
MRIFSTEDIPLDQIAQAVVPAARAADSAAEHSVREIVAAVRERGDEAVVAYSRERDWPEAEVATLRVPEAEIRASADTISADDRAALETAIARVRAFHEKQLPEGMLEPDDEGAVLGWRFTPLDSVAVYAPAGVAPLLSSLIMAVVPGQVAGVGRIAVATPPARDGSVNPGILAAAAMLGIAEVYRVGGPWAIAALAYGSKSIPAVDKIVGPGNMFVNLAKAMVAGVVGIDGFYGPSEVVVLADEHADARQVTIDLAAQAEHWDDSVAVLVTPVRALIERVNTALEDAVRDVSRGDIIRRCLERHGGAIHVRDLDEGVELVNLLAPEHLELAVGDPRKVLGKIKHAGCILLGPDTPTAVSDYLAGPSHVLPTGRSARFSSGLGVMDFMKRSSLVSVTPKWLARYGREVEQLARLEGLDAHARSVRIRTKQR